MATYPALLAASARVSSRRVQASRVFVARIRAPHVAVGAQVATHLLFQHLTMGCNHILCELVTPKRRGQHKKGGNACFSRSMRTRVCGVKKDRKEKSFCTRSYVGSYSSCGDAFRAEPDRFLRGLAWHSLLGRCLASLRLVLPLCDSCDACADGFLKHFGWLVAQDICI